MPGLAAALVFAGVAATANAASPSKPMFLVTNYEETRWCAFSSRAAADDRIERDFGLTLIVASATATGAIDDQLRIEWGPESGDWAVTDFYRLKGTLTVTVDREIGYADGRPVHQSFVSRRGRLTPGRARGGPGFTPNVAPYGDIARAPFYSVMRRAAMASSLPREGLCVGKPGKVHR